MAAAGFGAYWPVGGSVHVSRALCLLFQYMTADDRHAAVGGLCAAHRLVGTTYQCRTIAGRRALPAEPRP